MFGVIGEIEKFIIGNVKKEFIEYTSSHDEISEKLNARKMTLIDNENNKHVLEMIRANSPSKYIGCEDRVVLGAIATYYNTEDGYVHHGEITSKDLLACLWKKNLKYCYKDLDNKIHICEDTPHDMIEVRDVDIDNFDVKVLDTNLFVEAMTVDNRCVKIPVSAKYKIPSNKEEDDTPILFSDLSSLVSAQEDRLRRKELEKKLHITLDEFKNERVDDMDKIKYDTNDIRKIKILKIYERRFLDGNK